MVEKAQPAYTLNDLRDEVYDWAQRKGWWSKPEDKNVPSKLALIHSEVSEALEEFRKGKMETYYTYSSTPEGQVLNLGRGLDGKVYAHLREEWGGPVRQVEMTHERWLEAGYDAKPEGFASELADVIIRVVDLAGFLDIDLDKEVGLKMNYNETRAERHGGKAI